MKDPRYDRFHDEVNALAREFKFGPSQVLSVVQRVDLDEARRMLDIAHRNSVGLHVIHAAIDLIEKDRSLRDVTDWL